MTIGSKADPSMRCGVPELPSAFPLGCPHSKRRDKQSWAILGQTRFLSKKYRNFRDPAGELAFLFMSAANPRVHRIAGGSQTR